MSVFPGSRFFRNYLLMRIVTLSSALTWHGLLIGPSRRSCRCFSTVIKRVNHERRSQTNIQPRNQTKVTPLSYTLALKAVSKDDLLTLLWNRVSVEQKRKKKQKEKPQTKTKNVAFRSASSVSLVLIVLRFHLSDRSRF